MHTSIRRVINCRWETCLGPYVIHFYCNSERSAARECAWSNISHHQDRITSGQLLNVVLAGCDNCLLIEVLPSPIVWLKPFIDLAMLLWLTSVQDCFLFLYNSHAPAKAFTVWSQVENFLISIFELVTVNCQVWQLILHNCAALRGEHTNLLLNSIFYGFIYDYHLPWTPSPASPLVTTSGKQLLRIQVAFLI